MSAFSRTRGAIIGAVACFVALVLPTRDPLSAQRMVPTTGAARLDPGASASARAQFVAAAETNARGPNGRHRYIVVYREANAFAGLRDDSPLPTVRENVVSAVESRISQARGVRSLNRIGRWPIGVIETDDAEAAAALANDPNVAIVEQDQLFTMQFDREALAELETRNTASRTRRAQTTPWGVTMVGAPTAWARGARGQGVKVGIMDSGGDSDHPDLLWAGGFDATPSTVKSWEDNLSPCKGHGTHVAGTVAARDNDIGVVGVAPDVQLYAVRVFDNFNGSCAAWTSVQIVGINWMSTQGIQVANASIGGSFTGTYNSSVYTARQNGLLLVASSGNDNNSFVGCPACYNSSLAIGAVTSSKARASYSSYGSGLHFMAPGSGITSTMPGGGTGSKSGTSMASPHAAGVVAVVLSSRAGMSVSEAVQRIGASVEDLGAAGWDAGTGYGLVRADRAVEAVLGVGMQASTTEPVIRMSAVQGSYVTNATPVVFITGPEAMADGWRVASLSRHVLAYGGMTAAGANDWIYGSRTITVSPLSAAINLTTPPGVYTDTVVIRRGSTNAIIGRIPVEVTITAAAVVATNATLTPSVFSTSVRQDSVPTAGSSTLAITGTNSTTRPWTVSSTGRFTAVTTPSGTGNGTVRWSRQVGTLPVGTHVDTLRVQITGNSGPLTRMIVDSLTVRAIPAAPVVITLDPASRNRTLSVGASTTDSVLVTLSGGTGDLTWTASAAGTGLTLTRNTGPSGSHVVFNRSADAEGQTTATITVASGDANATYSDLVTGITTLTLSAAPTGRMRSLAPGAEVTDSVAVTFSGTGATTTPWTATSSGNGLTATTPSGVGSGWAVFRRAASESTAGVATLTISGGGLSAAYSDTLTLLAPLTLAVSPEARGRALLAGTSAADSVAITMTGAGADSMAWTASSSGQGLTVTTPTGTGSGWVTFTRTADATTTGVATLTVRAGGLSAAYTDTLTLAPPLTLAISPAGGARALLAGATETDSVALTLAGTGASVAAWTATSNGRGLAVLTPNGTGSGWVTFARTASTDASGVAVLTVDAGSATGTYADTLTLLEPLTLAVAPAGRSSDGLVGTSTRDSIQVTLAGTAAAEASWSATATQGLAVVNATGQGSGWLAFDRTFTTTTQQVGVIRVTSGALEATYSDTLRGLAPLSLALSPTDRNRTLSLGEAITDSVRVALEGTGAPTTPWAATTTSADLTLGTATGTGSGWVVFTRRATATGTQVASIAVTAANLQASYQDVATITAPIAAQVTPVSQSRTMVVGSTLTDSVQVTLTGTGASGTAWSASSSDPTLLALSTPSGIGTGWVRFERRAPTEGMSVASIQVIAGTGGASYTDSVVATTPLSMTLSPVSGFTTAIVGTSRADSVAIDIQGTGAATAPWTATSAGNTISLTSTTGTGPGWVRFTRGTPTEGTLVSTITVQVGDLVRTYTDTLVGTVSLALAITPAEHRRTLPLGAEIVDSFAVAITGTGANDAAWTASAEGAGLTLMRTSGTGSGWVSYRRIAVVEGEQTAQVRVASGALQGSGRDIVTGTRPLSLAVTPSSRTTTLTVGAAQTDSVAIQIDGTGGETVPWTVTTDGEHLATARTSGTGSGWVTFTRTALREGTMTGTIAVRAGDLEALFSDTLTGTIQLALQVSPTERSRALLVGTEVVDSIAVTLTGTGSTESAWTAEGSGEGIALLRDSGIGSGWVTYRRAALTEGERVAEIIVTSGDLSVTARDAVIGTRALTLSLAPASRQSSALVGVTVEDSIAVTILGTDADSTAWAATATGRSLTLEDGERLGSGWLRFTRTAPTEGLTVDTVTVQAGDLVATYIDSVTATTTLVAILTPASHFTSIRADSSARAGATYLGLNGTKADSSAWTLFGGRWTVPTTPSGVGPDSLRWERNTNTLAPGAVHVDTLWVSILGPQGELRHSILDSLDLRPIPTTLTLSPRGRSRALPLSSADTPAAFQVVVGGSGADSISWSATSLMPGLVVDSARGTGSGVVGYHWTGATAAGRLIGEVRVSLEVEAAEYTTTFTDTLVVLVPPPTTNTVLSATPDSIETRSVPGKATRETRTTQITPLGANPQSVRWRARRFGGAGMVSVGTGWRTGPGTLSFTTSHGAKTAPGVYADTLIVERLDALTQPLYVIHILRIANATQDRVTFLAQAAKSSYRADHRLVDPIVRTIGFTIDHPTTSSDQSWSVRHTGPGPLDISGNTRNGSGTTGSVTYTRTTLPLAATDGWFVDTLWVMAVGREHMYLDSLQVTTAPIAYSGPLAVAHNQGSRYWSTPAGADTRLNARLTITPAGPGADTLLWRTRVWPGTASPHAGTGAGTSKGPRSIIVWVDLDRNVGIHVDTIHTALLFDQRINARSLDTLEVLGVPAAPQSAGQDEPWADGLPLVAIPRLTVEAGEHPVALGSGVTFHAVSPSAWRLSLTETSRVEGTLEVFMAKASTAPTADEEASRQITLPVYRLTTLPTRRELLTALGDPQSVIAGWADALADGDGRFTLGDALRLFQKLQP